MENKLDDILNIIESNHIDFYFNHSKEELQKFKSEALAKYRLNDDYDLYYIVNYIIKCMLNENDCHTFISFVDDYKDTLDMRFRYINDKLYIYKINPYSSKYLYSEVLKINDVDIDVIKKEIQDIATSQTKGRDEVNVEDNLFIINHLRSLPSIDSNTKDFKLTIRHDGKIKKIKAPVGMYLKDNYKFTVDKDNMYIIYSQCSEKKKNQMIDFVNEIKRVENINNYILDLRSNTGGNSKIIKPLVKFLEDKNVIVLIDKYVFSAGRWACNDLKKIGATFIGTDIGTPMNCFGNCPPEMYQQFLIAASQKYFPFNDNLNFDIDSKEKLDMVRDRKEIFEPFYFHPDIYVEESIDALKEGRDVYLEKAYEYIDSLSKDKKY